MTAELLVGLLIGLALATGAGLYLRSGPERRRGDPSLPAATREVQARSTPEQVLALLMEGNDRFATGRTLDWDTVRQIGATASGQYPLAVVLACMDSRVASEIIFDSGLGDLMSVRVAGNIVSEEALGSMEFACAIAGTKVLMVLGHTRCGAVTATVEALANPGSVDESLAHLGSITRPISAAAAEETETTTDRDGGNEAFVTRVTALNVRRSMREIRERSAALRDLVDTGQVTMVGGVYDVVSGRVQIIDAQKV